MAKHARKTSDVKIGRNAVGGEFVVARPAVKPTKVTLRQIRDAVRKVKKERTSA
jgi:hypothetical protein